MDNDRMMELIDQAERLLRVNEGENAAIALAHAAIATAHGVRQLVMVLENLERAIAANARGGQQ